MKQKILLLISLFLSGNVLLASLLWINQNEVKNGFVRVFPPHVIGDKVTLDLGFNNFYLADVSADTLFLANYDAPLFALSVTTDLKDTMSTLMHLPDSLREKLRKPRLEKWNGKWFLLDGQSSAVIDVDYSKSHFKYKQYPNVNTFSAAIIPDEEKLIVRTFDSEVSQQILIVLNSRTGEVTHTFLPDKLQDGLFSTDGAMAYNKEWSLLTYVHYYRNSVVVLDTSLHVVNRFHTRDTVSTGRIRLEYLEEKKEITFKDPPLIVNKTSYTSGDWLYVLSGLKADNEGNGYQLNSVIDVYSLSEGTYRYSFYIPDLEHKKVSNFIVYQNQVITIQGQYLVSYCFDPSSFKEADL